MRFAITSGTVLFRTCFFLVSYVLHVKAEVGVQSYPPQVQAEANSLATPTENADGDLLSPIKSLKPDTPEPRLFRRAQRWTGEEEQRLLELRRQKVPWDKIMDEFPGRSWSSLTNKYVRLTEDPSKVPKRQKAPPPWTDEEQELLLELVESNLPWREIAERLPGRTETAARGKYRLLSGNFVPRKTWKHFSAEEDELLLELDKAGVP